MYGNDGAARNVSSVQFCDEVTQRRHRVVEYHTWTGVFHYKAYSVAMSGRITVDGAFAATGLVVSFRTTVKAAACVVEQFAAVIAQPCITGMMFPAIYGNHLCHYFFLAVYESHC